ncbi:MAG: NADH-quinone oxidoreductase subunit A [Candidatus Micrarchaeaceae archaeon]
MDFNVIAIILFIAFAIFTPVSMIITSKMLRRKTTRNPVKDAAYESAEASTGSRITIMNEYLHYFSMFIMFEILVAVVLVWAPLASSMQFIPSAAILSLLVFGMAFEAFILLIARKGE